MKLSNFLTVLSLLIIFHISTAQNNPRRNTIHRDIKIQPSIYTGYDFSKASVFIRAVVDCSQDCDVFLVSKVEIPRMRNNTAFRYFSRGLGVKNISLEHNIERNIQNGVTIVVYNPLTTPILATFSLFEDIPAGRDANTSILPCID